MGLGLVSSLTRLNPAIIPSSDLTGEVVHFEALRIEELREAAILGWHAWDLGSVKYRCRNATPGARVRALSGEPGEEGVHEVADLPQQRLR